jgi:hypothetical protein
MFKKIILIFIILIAATVIGYGIYQYLNSGTKEATEETMMIKIYLNNENSNPNSGDCSKVYPVDRVIPKTLGVAKAALQELFKGPTGQEISQGYVSWFSQKTQNILKSIKIESGTAYVDLTDIRQIIPNVSASCGSAQFLAEVETTLKQFESVKKVIIAIDGKPSNFYEWIQIGCAKENDFCDETHFNNQADTEQQTKKIIEARASETILAIKNKDAEKISKIIHPEKGVRFSPYQNVNKERDMVFSASQFLSFFKNKEKYLWGVYDGSGLPINLTPSEYYNKFIYNADFVSAPEVSYNRIIGKGNIINNVFESYPGAIVVEYHFSGFDPQYEGMDWSSLELVFEEKDAGWYLTGIVHGQWTI